MLNDPAPIAFVLRLREGTDLDEYERRHREIWPEMSAALRAGGISDYTIWIRGHQLFQVLRTQDLAATRARLEADPVVACWGRYMSDLLEPPQRGEGLAHPLREAFRMD